MTKSSGGFSIYSHAHLPDSLADRLNAAVARLDCNRSEVVRQAIEFYLEDIDDVEEATRRLRDADDPPLDWEQVKRELLASG